MRYTHLFLLLCIVFILLNSNNSTLTTTSREREREGRQTPPHTPSCFWKKKSVTLQNNLCNSNSNSHVQYDDAAAVVRYVGGGYVGISSFFFQKFSKICQNVKIKLFLHLTLRETVHLLISHRSRDPNDVLEIFIFLLISTQFILKHVTLILYYLTSIYTNTNAQINRLDGVERSFLR